MLHPRTLIRPLLILLLLAVIVPAAVLAQDGTLEADLQALNLSGLQVTVAADEVLVEYQQAVADFGTPEVELERIARILEAAGRDVTPERPVRIRQRFDDGQIMELLGAPAAGRAYLVGDLSAEDFQQGLIYQPRTRGPIIAEGACQPAAGDTCENKLACSCYPTETCSPGDPAADPRGCLPGGALPNAHLEGSQYVCDPGYQWNDSSDACVPLPACPAGSYAVGDACLPLGAAAPTAEPAPWEFLPLDFTVDSRIWIAGLACCGGLLLALVLIVVLLLRGRRRKKQAAAAQPPAAARAPAYQPPQRPAAFAQLERRYADIYARYRAGQLSEPAYQAALRELTLRDAAGQYWAYGPAGWQWYDGQRWVPRDPPRA